MSEVAVVAVLSVAEGRAGEAEALIRPLVEATHREAGCITFALHRDASDPLRLVLVERWEDEAALDAHRDSEHLAAFRTGAAGVMSEPARVLVLEPLPMGDGAKGTLAGD